MNSIAGPDDIVTPEAVAVPRNLAGAGSRMVAGIIDSLIQGGCLFVVAAALSVTGDPGMTGLVVFVVLVFLVVWAYYPILEGLWNGRTPGKAALRLRVVQTDGQPVTWGPVLVRNLVRIVDWIGMVGVLFMVLTKRFQRLGDLAAGTVVIRESPLPPPRELLLPRAGEGEVPLDTAGLTEREYEVVRSFLERRHTFDADARWELGKRLADTFRPRVHGALGDTSGHETFLESLARSYRGRFHSGPVVPPPP